MSSTPDRAMKTSPLAGKPADPSMLVNIPKLVTAYYTETPDPAVPTQQVAFGTSGHRGSAVDPTFRFMTVDWDGQLYLILYDRGLGRPVILDITVDFSAALLGTLWARFS